MPRMFSWFFVLGLHGHDGLKPSVRASEIFLPGAQNVGTVTSQPLSGTYPDIPIC